LSLSVPLNACSRLEAVVRSKVRCFMRLYFRLEVFLEKLSRLEKDLKEKKELFELEKGPGYPETANSDAYLIGKARYKDHDEKKAREYEVKYSGKEKQINFEVVNSVSVYEIKKIMQQMREILEK